MFIFDGEIMQILLSVCSDVTFMFQFSRVSAVTLSALTNASRFGLKYQTIVCFFNVIRITAD